MLHSSPHTQNNPRKFLKRIKKLYISCPPLSHTCFFISFYFLSSALITHNILLLPLCSDDRTHWNLACLASEHFIIVRMCGRSRLFPVSFTCLSNYGIHIASNCEKFDWMRKTIEQMRKYFRFFHFSAAVGWFRLNCSYWNITQKFFQRKSNNAENPNAAQTISKTQLLANISHKYLMKLILYTHKQRTCIKANFPNKILPRK